MSDAEAIEALLGRYFDGLYRSDADLLRTVFHPQALYACATEGLVTMDMATYLPRVAARPAPASRGDSRHDRVLSVELL